MIIRPSSTSPTSPRRWAAAALLLLAAPLCSRAQISLSTAVDLALRNSPEVKLAQADLEKARATLSEAHRAFVPSIVTTGGVGKSTGVPLGLPVVFSLSAQSLVFNFSQQDNVRAAHAGIDAAQFALNEARDTVALDVTDTYLSLDNALQRHTAVGEAAGFARRVTQIVQDRLEAGLESRDELLRSKRTAAQLHLLELRTDDEIDTLATRLAQLTGLPRTQPRTIHESIPDFPADLSSPASLADSPGVRASLANAAAKDYIAHGDARYSYRPQFAFSANYSRISTAFTNYAQYYRGFNTDLNGNTRNSFNSLNIGIQISIPLLDLVHQARARESRADANHARFQAEIDRNQLFAGRVKLRHATAELAAKAEIAALDRDLARNQIEALEIQLNANAANNGGQLMTPKDEQNARLQERQRFLDMLDADLQLRQNQLNLLKQNGQLGAWMQPGQTQPGQPRGGAPTAPGVAPPPTAPGVAPNSALPASPLRAPPSRGRSSSAPCGGRASLHVPFITGSERLVTDRNTICRTTVAGTYHRPVHPNKHGVIACPRFASQVSECRSTATLPV